MKTFAETYIFNTFNKTYKVADLLKKMSLASLKVGKELLLDPITNIEKTFNIPTKKAIIADYKNDLIVPIILPEDTTMPTSIPVFIIKQDNEFVAYVNISSYTRITKDNIKQTNSLQIDDKKLFAMLQFAWIYRKYYSKYEKINTNNDLIKISANMYAKLLYKPLDKDYSVGSSYGEIDRTQALLAYFFCNNIMGCTKYSKDLAANIPVIVDTTGAKALLQTVTIQPEENFDEFIMKHIRTNIKGCSKISTRDFLHSYARMYGGTALPSLEYFPYFAYLVSSASIGSFIFKDMLINGIIKTDGEKFLTVLNSILL